VGLEVGLEAGLPALLVASAASFVHKFLLSLTCHPLQVVPAVVVVPFASAAVAEVPFASAAPAGRCHSAGPLVTWLPRTCLHLVSPVSPPLSLFFSLPRLDPCQVYRIGVIRFIG